MSNLIGLIFILSGINALIWFRKKIYRWATFSFHCNSLPHEGYGGNDYDMKLVRMSIWGDVYGFKTLSGHEFRCSEIISDDRLWDLMVSEGERHRKWQEEKREKIIAEVCNEN